MKGRESDTLASLANHINTEHNAYITAIRTGLANAMMVGDSLIKAKALCEHGQWLSWLAKHCPGMSKRTAQYYMSKRSAQRKVQRAIRRMLAEQNGRCARCGETVPPEGSGWAKTSSGVVCDDCAFDMLRKEFRVEEFC